MQLAAILHTFDRPHFIAHLLFLPNTQRGQEQKTDIVAYWRFLFISFFFCQSFQYHSDNLLNGKELHIYVLYIYLSFNAKHIF